MSRKFTPMFSIVVGDKILAMEDDCHIFHTSTAAYHELNNMNTSGDILGPEVTYSQIICMFEITEVRPNGLKKVEKNAVSDFETYKHLRLNIVKDINNGINISYTMEFFEIQF